MSSSLPSRAINSSTVAISNSVERLRVVVQHFSDRCFRQLREALARRRHRIHEALGMRIVGADEKAIVARKVHHQWQHALLGIGADPDVAGKVLARGALHLRGMPHVFEAIVEALSHSPTHPAIASMVATRSFGKRSNTPSYTMVVSAMRGSWITFIVMNMNPGS